MILFLKKLFQVDIKSPDGFYYICFECYRHAINFEIPTMIYSPTSVLRFPEVDRDILACNELELLALSPRIAFSFIRDIGWDRQKGLRGNIVNVPIDVPKTILELPRKFCDFQVIQLNFKRRKHYTRNIIETTDTIRPFLVMKCLKVLMKLPLYMKLNIKISEEKLWSLENSAADPNHKLEFVLDKNENDSINNNLVNISNDEKSCDDDEDENKAKLKENILNGGNDNLENGQTLINNHYDQQTLKELSLTIAPGELNSPIPICFDELAESGTFISVWGGNIIKKDENITILNRCKSHLRNTDRRIAQNIPYLFWLFRYLMARRLINAINTNVRRDRVKEKNTVNNILECPEKLKQYSLNDDLKKIISAIRGSPLYFGIKRRVAFAMNQIRQFGSSELFLTLSPRERDSPELIVLLEKLLNNNEISIEYAQQRIDDSYDKTNKIKRDSCLKSIITLIAPVTVARWNENRLSTSYIVNPNVPFRKNPLVDLACFFVFELIFGIYFQYMHVIEWGIISK